MDRRSFLHSAALFAGGAFLGGPSVRMGLAAPVPGVGPYGALGAANSDGLQLPVGFTSRLIAVSGQTVANTSYKWHAAPDGGACIAHAAGGWVYVSNGEAGKGVGSVGAIAFDAQGAIVDSYAILTGSSRSCSGGMTPWGSYLSGEENGSAGRVFECNPFAPSQGVHRPGLGAFGHEMIAVDVATGNVYMVEDHSSGRLYRFVPTRAGDLTAGQLYAAKVASGHVSWVPVSAAAPNRSSTTTAFGGAEGLWIMGDVAYFTTKLDVRVWRLDLTRNLLSVFYDYAATPGSSLDAVDNVVGHAPSRDLFVAEDGGNLEVGLLTTAGPATVAPFLRFVGHDQSEVSGIAFTPDGTRLYVSSQRGTDGATGRTYEVSGPFRRLRNDVVA